MRTRTRFPHPVTVHDDIAIPMPDGTRLSARLWRPEGTDGPVPLILEHLPYRKRDGTIARDSLTHPWFAGHGYACLRVDMRGNGDSDGLMADEYTETELQDACDVIAWARTQDWCSGDCGMMGISWGGFNALQVAALRPPGLKAIVTLCSSADRFADDIHYKGGCLLGENLGWATTMLGYSSRPPDPAVVGERWRAMWLDRLEHQPFHLSDWLAHQRRDAYWRHGSVCEDWGAIKAAVLAIGGWHDGYRNTVAKLVENLDAPAKGIVGPWNHKYPHIAEPGPTIGFLQEALRWWNRWLKGRDTGVDRDPAMRLWLMDSVPPARHLTHRPGRWIAEADWPAPGIAPLTLHLSNAGLAAAPAPLSARVASPADCGAAAGEFFPFAYGPELPDAQNADDARSACFDAPPAAAETDIVGAPRIALRLSSDRPQGQIAVRLCDVFPDGTSALITHGVLNLAHRASHAAPEPLPPGEPVAVELDLDQIAYRLPAGHRLRVAISTACWPFLWPAPEAATLTLQAGHVAIPIRPTATGDEWAFEPAEGAPPWPAETLRAPAFTRETSQDPATGETCLAITHDAGAARDAGHGLATSSITRERWTIRPDDPLSATAEMQIEKEMSRGDWAVRTEGTTRLTADATDFHLSARLRAYEGERLIFDKSFEGTIPRDNL